LLVLVAVALANDTFESFMQKYDKVYASEEEAYRRTVFGQNKARIITMNAEAQQSGSDAVFAINEFSDLTPEEFKKMYKGYKPSGTPRTIPSMEDFDLTAPIPTSYDWRKQSDAVTAVKDQGRCGSCWAFSATEGIESAWILKKKEQVVLAPQQVVSCDKKDGGCNGGDLPSAFDYVKQNGQEGEKDYPYTSGRSGQTGTCQFKSQFVVVHISGFSYATRRRNETEMQAASLANGPLSVCVDANSWQSYHSGILQKCGNSLDHCVQIVGWDVDATSKIPYWIVRNSWGTGWGISGYIYVAMNKNLCGIATEATYVTIGN